jgi:putative flippase GtrA
VLKRIFDIRREISKFFGVGLLAYLVGVGGFNLLVHIDSAPLASKPLTASLISGTIAILVAYFGNRHWTWKSRKWSGTSREITLFFIINGITLVINLLCLAVSRYLLGFESIVADNIASNIIGTGIGTMFRFWSYRTHVFKN